MIICNTKDEVRKTLGQWRRDGITTALVPTMGALHAGHLSLIETANELGDKTIATIFVNPLQFGPNEDFDTYPRTLENDIEILKSKNCDLLFAPERPSLFPDNFSTEVKVAKITENHCGASRPLFFGGIATIVTKLLMITAPDIAVFGEKDYQQLTMIKRMTRDLDIPCEVIGAPTVREADGLAMSSRNKYLSSEERAIAPALHATLLKAAKKLCEPRATWTRIRPWAANELAEAGITGLGYFDLVDAETLEMIDSLERPGRLLAAALLGKTRLIDNVPAVRTPE